MPLKRALIINAYSKENQGDGLLVELTDKILRESGFSNVELFAVDNSSFRDEQKRRMQTAPMFNYKLTFFSRLMFGSFFIKLIRADLVVSVGGGFLRFTSFSKSLRTLSVHVSQIAISLLFRKQIVLMPQSIGPIRHFKSIVFFLLKRAQHIYVRDDLSFNELRTLKNVSRTPDLGALQLIGTKPYPIVEGSARPGIIIRDIDYLPNWNFKVKELLDRRNFTILTQSQTGKQNEDVRFLKKIIPDELPIILATNAFERHSVNAVVSVRLHGALMAMRMGIPAIHISYERKGFGVFSDLGLQEFMFNGSDLDIDKLLECLEKLNASETERIRYFELIDRRSHHLVQCKKFLVSNLTQLNLRVQ